MAVAGKITINLEAQVARLQADMNKASSILKRADSDFRRIGKAAGGAIIGAFSVQSIASIASFSAETERLKSRFQAFTGSALEAENAMSRVDQTANRLGTNADHLKESFLAFAGAAKGSGIEASQAEMLFNSLSDSMVRAGFSSENIRSSFDALQKMFLKGTIAGKDLRSEVFQQMPQALDALSQAFGMTNEEFIKLIDSSDVMAKDLLPELTQAMADLTKNASIDSTVKEFERFKNTLDDIQESAVKAFNSVVSLFSAGAKEIANSGAGKAFSGGISEIGKFFSGPSQAVPTQDELTRSMIANEAKAQEERKAVQVAERRARIPSIFKPKKAESVGRSSISQEESAEVKKQREQAELAKQILDEMNRLYEDHERTVAMTTERVKRSIETPQQALEAYSQELNMLRDEGRITLEQHAEAVKEASDQIYGTITSQRSLWEQNTSLIRSWGDQFTDTFVDGITKGKFAFKDFANSILNDLLRISIQRSITQPLMESLLGDSKKGGGLLSGLFGGKRASGGSVSPSKAYLVGEKGPELFSPASSGSIIPNSKLGGGVNVSVNVINQSKSNVQVQENSTSDGGKSLMIMVSDMVNESLRKGMLDTAMRTSYGIARRGR